MEMEETVGEEAGLGFRTDASWDANPWTNKNWRRESEMRQESIKLFSVSSVNSKYWAQIWEYDMSGNCGDEPLHFTQTSENV